MERCAQVRFSNSKFVHVARYIHKYYLPQELRSKIFPVDIDGIASCFMGDDEFDIGEGRIPDKVPDCLIQYKDIGLEKRIDAETARRVILAKAAYYADVKEDLTQEENQAAMNLNAWFVEWEKKLLARCIQLSNEMKQQVLSGDCWLTDYEIDVEVGIYVRDDDPYYIDNIPDAQNDDIDCDTSLLCTLKSLVHIPIQNVGCDDYWGIGDNRDHNDLRELGGKGFYGMRHCQSFHELFSHACVPMKHAGRIGRICTDIIVSHQNGVNIDLKGDRTIAVRDEPQIRECMGYATK